MHAPIDNGVIDEASLINVLAYTRRRDIVEEKETRRKEGGLLYQRHNYAVTPYGEGERAGLDRLCQDIRSFISS